MRELTSAGYWDELHTHRDPGELVLDGYGGYINRVIYEILRKIDLDGKRIIEVGGGGSEWLIHLASVHRSSSFFALDYSSAGCEALRQRAMSSGIDICVVQADLFSPPEWLFGTFDIAITFGVVEHFDNLSEVLIAIRKLVRPGGIIFSLIPNMRGAIGKLLRWMNRTVYEMHNPHDLESIIVGHEEAKLQIVDANYLCSTNFGVLSACVEPAQLVKWNVYKTLSRVSKLIWVFESTLFKLPVSGALSPYIYCVSRVPAGAES